MAKVFLGENESKKILKTTKKLYWDVKQAVIKTGSIPIELLLREDSLLVDWYNLNRTLRLDQRVVDSSIGDDTDVGQIILYLLCLANKLPEIPVELRVQYNYEGEFKDVYNTLIDSVEKEIYNPLVITSFYIALQKSLAVQM